MRELGGPGHSQACLLELSQTPEGKNASEEQNALTVTRKLFLSPGLVKLSPEADVSLTLDVVTAHMLSPIQKDPCHLGTLAQVIVTVLVSGAQGLPGTFLVAGKHSKAAILETQGSWLQDLPGRPW